MKKLVIILTIIVLLTGCSFIKESKEKSFKEEVEDNKSNLSNNEHNLSEIEKIKSSDKYTKVEEKIDKYDNYTIFYTRYFNSDDSKEFATIVVSDIDDLWGYITESTYAGQNDTDEYIIAEQNKLYIQNNNNLYIFDIKTGKLESKIDNFGYGEKYIYSDDDYIIFTTSTYTHVLDTATDIIIINKKDYKISKIISAKENVDIHVRDDKSILLTYKLNYTNGESKKEYELTGQDLLKDNFTNDLVTIYNY